MSHTRRRPSLPCGIDQRIRWGRQLAAALPWLVALVLILVPQQSWAAAPRCSVNVQSVNFGKYDPFSNSPHDITAVVSVSCTAAIPFQISFGTGIKSYRQRGLAKGSSTLRYNLYTSATHATVWGDGTGGTGRKGGNVLRGNFTVYGRIPARQNVSVGTYSDVITVTVDY